jgi:hypothetical protein
VFARIRKKRNDFLRIKREHSKISRNLKKEQLQLRIEGGICNHCTLSLKPGEDCPVCNWSDTRVHRSSTQYNGFENHDNIQFSDSEDDDVDNDTDWESDGSTAQHNRLGLIAQHVTTVPQQHQSEYLSRKDDEYREVVNHYKQYKKHSNKEPLGTIRLLQVKEQEYLSFMSPIYNSMPLLKQNYINWKNPPKSWTSRYQQLKTNAIITVLENIHRIAHLTCSNTPRFKWMETLQSLPPGVSRFVWCLMFCKATNGVSDVVVCQHFKIAITKIGALTMEDLIADPVLIARILRQTSKWAKNSVRD